MRVTIDMGRLDALRAELVGFSDLRLRSAVATGLTRTAVAARDAVRRELPRRFDRPAPYTLNSLFVRGARPDRLDSETGFKDDGNINNPGYLLPQSDGGRRPLKRFEHVLRKVGYLPPGMAVVPGKGARLDGHGNVSRGQIIQVLSQLRAQTTAGYTRNMAFGPQGIAAQRKAGGRFFAVPAGLGVAPGVYQRDFIGRNITPVLMFVRQPMYRQRLDFDGITRGVAQRELPIHVRRSLAEHMARLAARGKR